MDPIIVARNLSKSFNSLCAVDRIDFTINSGEVLGFLGPNGAGKTTTIRMITCTSPLTSGSLTVFGLDVETHPREIKAQTGVVPQENNFDPDFTVLENLTTYGRYFRLNGKEVRQRAQELLDFVQLSDKAKERVENLSGGMKRRLILARSLLNRPRLLILDEPTTGLDPQGRRMIWQKIQELRRTGVTVVLTTHYMEEAQQICDRVLIMDRARIIAEGAPRDLIAAHVGNQVLEMFFEHEEQAQELQESGLCDRCERLGNKFEVFTPDPQAALARIRSRVPVASYSVREGNLEDVFLRLTGREIRD
jgi:lipooligosaccharide transport system ATP-binding protein